MILVCGATGTTGRQVVKQLTARGAEFRALAHSADSARRLQEEATEAAVGDLDAPNGLNAALDGVHHAFLVTPPDERQVARESNFIDAAAQAGVQHVVKLSALGADAQSPARLGRSHGQVEQKLRDSGIGYTLLRPNGFMDNFLANAELISSSGVFYSSIGEAPVSFVAASDIGVAAAAALAEEGHQGKTYTLTGPAAVTYEDVARILTDQLGSEVSHQQVTDEDARAAMLGAGMGPWLVDGLVELFEFYRAGHAAAVEPGVKDASGHEPKPYEEWLEDNLGAFQA